MAKSYPPSSPGARRNARPDTAPQAPDADPNGALERSLLASILESPAQALDRPNLRWLCANAPRSFSDPLCGLAAAEVHRQGPEANLATVISELERAEQIDCEGRRYLLTLAAEALPVDLAELDAQKLVEDRRPARLAETLKEASAQLESIPTRWEQILEATGQTLRTLASEGPGALDTPLTLTSLPDPREPDPDELIQDRFLCRGATLLFVGRTGLGKSSFTLQLAIAWATGRDCFGFRPAAPLRSLFVQSENDSRDLAEMRSGIFDGLGLPQVERTAAGEAVHVATIDDSTGIEFVRRRLTPLVERVKPDLLWLDPLLAYLGGDVSDQKTVSDFLRVHLAPIIHRARLGFIPIHHTPKAPREDNGNSWATTDFAYAGAGSAELANFPRAVVSLEPTKRTGIFKLRLGKRGRRLGWLEVDGETPAYERLIAHGRRGIFWREPDPDEELTASTGAFNRSAILELVPGDRPISKDALISLAKTRKDIGEKRAKGFLAELLDAEEVFEWRVARKGTNPKRFIARRPQAEEDLE